MNQVRAARRVFPVGLVLVLVLALALVGLELLREAGQFTALAPHFAGSCRDIVLGASAEDLVIDRPRGLAYLSYLDRRGLAAGKPVRGTVMLVDLGAPEPRPRAAVTSDPAEFRPAALSLLAPAGAPQRLFVISHRPGQGSAADEAIEILEQSPAGGFRPIDTVRDPLLEQPRAVLAVGPREFYVTVDSGGDGLYARALEALFHHGLATLDYYDGKTLRPVVTGLAGGTGLGMSPDGRRLYVGEALARRIAVYARDAASGTLSLERRIDLGSAPAAIDVDEAGNLWVAAHPRALALWRYLSNPDARAPTQVLRISPADWKPVEVYLDGGGRLAAGSVAAASAGTLLVGSIMEPKLLRCTLP